MSLSSCPQLYMLICTWQSNTETQFVAPEQFIHTQDPDTEGRVFLFHCLVWKLILITYFGSEREKRREGCFSVTF